jgi:hypothetical protein
MTKFKPGPFGGSRFRRKLASESGGAKQIINNAREFLERGKQEEQIRAFGEYLKTEKKESV